MIDTGKAVDADLVVTESSGTESEMKDDSCKSKNDTDADDTDIRPIYDEEPMADLQLTAEFLGKSVLQSLRNQSVVRQLNAFKSEWPQIRDSIFAKPDHMIASSECRNSSKNMPRFSLNDMLHNHYLNEARKKTQKRDRNPKSSVIPSNRFQSTADDSKPKSRRNNQTPRSLPVSKSSYVTIMVVPKANHSKSSSSFLDSKHLACSTCHKCVFNANHDACITKLLKEVNSSAKIQSHKTKNSNKPVDQKCHTQKPGRQIFTRNRWISKGKLFNSCTGKDDYELTHGSNVDIPNTHEYKQTLDLSASTSLTGQQKQRISFSAGTSFNVKQENLRYNGENQVVSKTFAVTTVDASDKHQQQPNSTLSTSTLATSVIADGNFDMKHFKTLSLDESRSADFDLSSNQEEYLEGEVAKKMTETMVQYMSKTQADYGSGVVRPKIEEKENFELKGQFLKELRTNTFSCLDHEDENEHVEKVLKIVDLFHILILL
nr:hypothetical protein [Tanacetum cinerariifolium]